MGQEVGYHVGQNRVANNKTGLLFATAGILLEELRSNGIEALTKYKVVLIDECHERSAESDLCLAIIKSFLTGNPTKKVRLVLMSATFNHGRYTSYFDGVPGCEVIDTITLQTAGSITAFYSRVQTYYLEDVMKMIPTTLRDGFMNAFEKQMRLDPASELAGDDGGKSLSHSLLMLMMILVTTLHQEEDPEAIFLIFAPTYRHLDQIYGVLNDLDSNICRLLINVLHSSIDMEDCLKSMHSRSDRLGQTKRRILLASAIADSSVTIPGVTCVIDTCRALEVRWDSNREVHIPKTVWASKSICDQRRGRTGRTCPGRVFRLLNQSFYINQLTEWDQPQIELASCRDEVLSLLSSTNKVMSDPQALLQRCLDPPPKTSLKKAIKYLENIGACKEVTISRKVKLVPTDYGKLLAALPYRVTDGSMIVRGALNGLLHEALALVSILSTRPYPIVHVFGESEYNEATLRSYYQDVNPKDPKSVALANFAAYLFWHVTWNTAIRGDAAKARFLRCNSTCEDEDEHEHGLTLYPYSQRDTADDQLAYDCNVWNWSPHMEEAHIEWCAEHSINPTSVRAIESSVDVALKTLYKKEHEPEWLRCQPADPDWNLSQIDVCTYITKDMFGSIYGTRGIEICDLLVGLQDQSLLLDSNLTIIGRKTKSSVKQACIHFLKGNCTFGDRCKNAHSFTAPRPPCRFFLTVGCRNAECVFSHAPPVSAVSENSAKSDTSSKYLPIHSRFEGGALAWYKQAAPNLLLFGEADFSFTRALALLQIRPLIATTNDSEPLDPSAESYCDLVNVDATLCHSNLRLSALPASRLVTSCAWNFPFTGQDEDESVHESLLAGALMSAAEYLESKYLFRYSEYDEDDDPILEFAIALQGDQFSRWSVLRSARRAGLYLQWWDVFNDEDFPGYDPKRGNGDRFPVQNARFYVFRLKVEPV